MKIALLTDTHFGVRNDNQLMLDENTTFFNKLFFPYLDKHNITTVVHLGDVVDRRKYINYATSNRLSEDLLEPLKQRGIDTYFIAGNHDCYYNNTNEVNALRELFKDNYPNFRVYDGLPEEVIFDGMPILFVPWINDDKVFASAAFDKVAQSNADVIMGHLQIQGFEMHKGSIISHGIDRSVFSKFDTVLSGHFHHKSSDGHIYYLGSHAEFTWADYDDKKGFHIFDTETKDIKFIVNPSRMFHKLIYDDSNHDLDIEEIDFSVYTNRYVKVVVKNKNNHYLYDRFIDKLDEHNPYEYQIVDDNLNLNIDDTDIVSEAESTLDICYTVIDKIGQNNRHTSSVKKMMAEIYNEALLK